MFAVTFKKKASCRWNYGVKVLLPYFQTREAQTSRLFPQPDDERRKEKRVHLVEREKKPTKCNTHRVGTRTTMNELLNGASPHL